MTASNIRNFRSKIVQERGGPIRFIRAEEEGAMCWFYLRLNPEKLPEYEKALAAGEMNIREFGTILESNWGSYPPEDVVAFMREHHGFETPPADEASRPSQP